MVGVDGDRMVGEGVGILVPFIGLGQGSAAIEEE
jgi:hypothetical protein